MDGKHSSSNSLKMKMWIWNDINIKTQKKEAKVKRNSDISLWNQICLIVHGLTLNIKTSRAQKVKTSIKCAQSVKRFHTRMAIIISCIFNSFLLNIWKNVEKIDDYEKNFDSHRHLYCTLSVKWTKTRKMCDLIRKQTFFFYSLKKNIMKIK